MAEPPQQRITGVRPGPGGLRVHIRAIRQPLDSFEVRVYAGAVSDEILAEGLQHPSLAGMFAVYGLGRPTKPREQVPEVARHDMHVDIDPSLLAGPDPLLNLVLVDSNGQALPSSLLEFERIELEPL